MALQVSPYVKHIPYSVMELGGGAAFWSLENVNFTGTVVHEHDSELEFQDSRLPHVHKSFKFAHGWNKGIVTELAFMTSLEFNAWNSAEAE